MTLSEMRDMIAYVPQEAMLFNTSIIENIRYGKAWATDEEIFGAARAANADGFIREQPQGYETLIGERGIRLSEAVLKKVHYKLYFSKATFITKLFRVILINKIFKGFRINCGEPYHK